MDRPGVRIILSLLLIAAGVLFLLDNQEVVEIGDLMWAVLSAVAGIMFLVVFVLDREQWWALIPGFVLLTLALVIFAAELLPALVGEWLGAVFLGGLGLAFLAVFLVRRDFWWAIIPAGVLLTLALVAGLSSTLPGEAVGGLFFLGMGLTFALLSLVQTPQGRMRWPLIPAGVLVVLGLAAFAVAGGALLSYLWPAALILAGLYLLARFFIASRKR